MIVAGSPRFRQRDDDSPLSRWPSYLLALCGLATVACGDTLVPGSSLDRLEFSFNGALTVPPSDEPASPLRFGVLWVDPTQTGKANYVSGAELVRAEIQPDATYTFGLLGPPPGEAIRSVKSSSHGGPVFTFAWGEIILYEDHNADQTFAAGSLAEGSPMVAPDVYRGMPTDGVLLYFSETIPPHQLVTPELHFPPTKGYHVGVVRCWENDQSPAASPLIQEISPPSAIIQMTAPSITFPNLRSCLRSHPASGDP